MYEQVASILGMDLAIPVRAILAVGGVFHLVLLQVWMMMMMMTMTAMQTVTSHQDQNDQKYSQLLLGYLDLSLSLCCGCILNLLLQTLSVV